MARLWKATLERFANKPEIKTIELPPHILRHARGDGLTREGASIYAIRHHREHSSIATSQIEAGDERLIEEAASINLPAPRRLSRPGGD